MKYLILFVFKRQKGKGTKVLEAYKNLQPFKKLLKSPNFLATQ